jgi:transposase
MSPETLRLWIRQDEVDSGKVAGVTTEEPEEVCDLKRKVRELEETIEILKAAAGFFARECDPRFR